MQGDRIIVVVQKIRSLGDSSSGGATGVAGANRVKRGDIKHAIVVRTAKKLQRKDGMVIRFDDNACALIGKNGEPIGTRINGRFALILPCLRPIFDLYSTFYAIRLVFDCPSEHVSTSGLMLSQESLARNFEIGSGRRSCHSQECMHRMRFNYQTRASPLFPRIFGFLKFPTFDNLSIILSDAVLPTTSHSPGIIARKMRNRPWSTVNPQQPTDYALH